MKDVTILQQQMAVTNLTLSEIRSGVNAALDYMAEQERVKQIIWTLVKQEALKK
mgnify:CR=1 FL=1